MTSHVPFANELVGGGVPGPAAEVLTNKVVELEASIITAGAIPGAGVPVSTGITWGTSITLGTGVETALGNALNAASGLVGFGGSVGAATATPTLTIGAQQTTQGGLVLANTAAGAYSTTLKSSNSASAAWTLTLPTTAGTNSYVLQTDGNGATSWVAKSITSDNVGTAATNCVAEEHGDGFNHITKITCTAVALGTSADNDDLAIGGLVYTFPAGAIMVTNGSVKGVFDQPSHGIIADGEIGLGTVVGSTAVDTIAEVGATSGDIMRGQAISSYTLGTTVATVANTPVTAGYVTAIAAGASPRTVYLNLAATWPDIEAPEAVTFTGVVTLGWRIIS